MTFCTAVYASPVERPSERGRLEPVTGAVVVASQQRAEGADQADVPVQVVEDQRDRLLAMLHVFRRGLVELLEERRHHLVDQQIAHLLGECDLPGGRGLVIGSRRDGGQATRGEATGDDDSEQNRMFP